MRFILFSILFLGDIMFYKHFIMTKDGEQFLYLYMLDQQEFAADLKKGTKDESVYRKVINYMQNAGVDFKGKKVFLVINGIIVSSITLDTLNLDTGKSYKLEDLIQAFPQEEIELLDLEDHPSLKLIDLKRSNGLVEKLKLEDYVIGSVSGEMPALFHEEALKAQAVIARTYAMKQLEKGRAIKDYNDRQIYRDVSYLKEIWGKEYEFYQKKIKDAVKATKDQVLMYDDDYIDTYYHLMSNGRTENSKEVLKLAYPYLVSVPSTWDLKESSLVGMRTVSNKYLSQLLNTPVDKQVKVQILEKTEGNRVRYVQFGNKVFDGLILSRRLGLNSNDFSVQIEEDSTTFVTRGNGHGLGLSKYGAEGMAESGYNYQQILHHYYPNTVITKTKS